MNNTRQELKLTTKTNDDSCDCEQVRHSGKLKYTGISFLQWYVPVRFSLYRYSSGLSVTMKSECTYKYIPLHIRGIINIKLNYYIYIYIIIKRNIIIIMTSLICKTATTTKQQTNNYLLTYISALNKILFI